ncbi:hypothetical protein J5N97_020144 [Dioscorea zingiberensis]|uniref:Myb-like domain-containing protein n=1 Tax=Dioscorea zingiberensis TaxID=325984 RepID=A0A9D5CFY2_9LILI|nr:hypothetical protein J5N97_020144 [Dioscorea zingiberensis]
MSSADADMKYPSDKLVEEDSKKSEKKRKSRKKNEESDVLEVSDVTNRETSVGGASENGMDLDGSELKSGKNRKMGKKRKKSDPMKDSDFGEALDDQGIMNLDETELESEKTSTSSSSKETTQKMTVNKKQKGKSSKLVTLDTAAKSSESLGNEGSEDLGSNKSDRKRRKDDNVEAEKYGHSRKKKVKQASKIVSQHATEDDVDGSPSMTNGNCEENDDMQERNNGAADFEKPKTKKKVAKNMAEKKAPNLQKGGTDDIKTSGLRKKKKVSFAGDGTVIPPGNKTRQHKCKEDEEEDLVQGKRFTPEEDEIVKKAVLDYIEEKQLGEEGVDMVMNCKKHPQVKKCWKTIGASLPWRPYQSVYYRAHILFERSEHRKWKPEEIEFVKKYHKKHGPRWSTMAKLLGKHRFHVKDTWRRIRLTHLKRGKWSQEEYQTLFDLVNMDLRMKASMEKKSKHGMLRDNISWEPISEKLETRNVAICCMKWYKQLTSRLVYDELWADSDDYRLMDALQNIDACCVEDVDWDNLLEHRSGDICRKRWGEMIRYIGGHKEKSFIEQVDILSQRYCPEMLEYKK